MFKLLFILGGVIAFSLVAYAAEIETEEDAAMREIYRRMKGKRWKPTMREKRRGTYACNVKAPR